MCDEVTTGPIRNTSESEVGIQRDFPAAYNAKLSWRPGVNARWRAPAVLILSALANVRL